MLDENFPLVDDKMYFSRPTKPYQLIDVTDVLIKKGLSD